MAWIVWPFTGRSTLKKPVREGKVSRETAERVVKEVQERVVKEVQERAVKEVQEQALGRKFDQDKPRWDLLPWDEVEEIVEILTFGSEKYEDNNWQHVKGSKWRYFGALCRHTFAWWRGETLDKESGKSHLAHAGCCLLFLMWFDNQEKSDESQRV